jgi:hypothetical protein
VSVTDCGEGFHAEKEGLGKRTRRHLGDALATEHVKARENQVNQEIGAQDEGRKPWPTQGQNDMIGVS